MNPPRAERGGWGKSSMAALQLFVLAHSATHMPGMKGERSNQAEK
jgi:hypothetical protein